MITKERLEELIEQGATIWTKDLHFLELNKNDCFMNSKNLLQFGNFHYTNDYLFETEEDARWKLEMTGTKTVTLELPTWKEFITNDKYGYYGTSYFEFGDGYRLIVRLPSEDDDCEFIGIDVDGNCELYHWEEATKENYIEACKLCLKLFNGEEV